MSGRSVGGFLWVTQSELPCGLCGARAKLLQIDLAARPWAQGRVGVGCSGSQSSCFLVAWNEVHVFLLWMALAGQSLGLGWSGPGFLGFRVEQAAGGSRLG